jgi:hypothetical protein
MRYIKLAILSGIFIFILVWLISLLIPSQIRISRAVDISAPKDSIAAAIKDMRRWEQWNILLATSGLTNPHYTATAITADQVKVLQEPSGIDTLRTRWQQQGKKVLQSGFTWQGTNDQMVVQWYFDVQLKWYPWEKFSSIVFDKQLGPPMEKSLANLKKLLEKNP